MECFSAQIIRLLKQMLSFSDAIGGGLEEGNARGKECIDKENDGCSVEPAWRTTTKDRREKRMMKKARSKRNEAEASTTRGRKGKRWDGLKRQVIRVKYVLD